MTHHDLFFEQPKHNKSNTHRTGIYHDFSTIFLFNLFGGYLEDHPTEVTKPGDFLFVPSGYDFFFTKGELSPGANHPRDDPSDVRILQTLWLYV